MRCVPYASIIHIKQLTLPKHPKHTQVKHKIFGLTNVHILITNLKKKCDEKDFIKMQIVRLIRIKFKKKKNKEN